MIFKSVHYTDMGPVRSSNQDSYTIKIAHTSRGPVAMAVMCDGMGGLSEGEVASAHMILQFEGWFWNYLPDLLNSGINPETLSAQWNGLVQEANRALLQYADLQGHSLGTTVLALLIAEGQYYLLHVGDCRAYLMKDGAEAQLTCDQTLAMQKLKAGELRPQDLATDPSQHVLLQCVGGTRADVIPEFFCGDCTENSLMLLCSDGFYHNLTNEQLEQLSYTWQDAEKAQQLLKKTAESCRQRGETDNISALMLLCIQPTCLPTMSMAEPPEDFRMLTDIVSIHTDKNL